MLKNIKLLSIVGLLLFISNVFCISKTIFDTPKLYFPTVIKDAYTNINYTDKYDTSKGIAEQAIETMGLKDYPRKVIFTNQNFEIFNKTDKPITIALQYSRINPVPNKSIFSKPIFEIIQAKTQSTVIKNLQYGGVIDTEINGTGSGTLTLYIWPNKSTYIAQKSEKMLDVSNTGPVYVYTFNNLQRLKKILKDGDYYFEGNPKYTIYVTFDGKIDEDKGDIGLRPQTGQLGKLGKIFGKETGLASKTETGLSLVTNIDKGDIKLTRIENQKRKTEAEILEQK